MVPDGHAGERIDRWLAEQPGTGTRSQIERAIEAGRVLVDGRRVKPSHRLRGGERVELSPPPVPPEEPVARDAPPLSVLYCDDAMIVVDKAPGVVVHPAAGHRSGTLVDALRARFPAARWPGGAERAGIVHRLDRDTSGVLLVARTVEAHEALARQFRKREVGKEYLALVYGDVRVPGRVDDPIGRHPRDRKRMSVAARRGRRALTEYEPLERFGQATLLRVALHTGRTHQIRVHLASRGWPVVGDRTYGRRRGRSKPAGSVERALAGMPRQALHAWKIRCTHPVDGRALEFEAPVPADFASLLEVLRRRVRDAGSG
ncbi:MAG: RluA family pseudouridine synthase [Deltaproteobacteria bacterium]|nr:MAG: RluA family pseudouridine synthase [Deltaproteobacteria bacterium]